MNYYAVVFLLRPPDLLCRESLFEGTNDCNFPGKWCVHTARRDSKSLCDSKFTTPSKFSESGKGGWKTQGGGKHTVNSAKNPSPKTFLDPPPTIRFPPPFLRLSVISLKRKRHRPDQAQFLRPPKVVLESTLCSTFPPPPPIHAIRFAPPSAAAQNLLRCSIFSTAGSFG